MNPGEESVLKLQKQLLGGSADAPGGVVSPRAGCSKRMSSDCWESILFFNGYVCSVNQTSVLAAPLATQGKAVMFSSGLNATT